MGTIKRLIAAGIPAVAGGAVTSLIDNKLLDKQPTYLRVGGKLVAAGLAAVFLRRSPTTAQVLMGSILGTVGYEVGTKLAGGILAPNKPAALSLLVREDPTTMQALVSANGQVQSLPSLSGFGGDVNLG